MRTRQLLGYGLLAFSVGISCGGTSSSTLGTGGSDAESDDGSSSDSSMPGQDSSMSGSDSSTEHDSSMPGADSSMSGADSSMSGHDSSTGVDSSMPGADSSTPGDSSTSGGDSSTSGSDSGSTGGHDSGTEAGSDGGTNDGGPHEAGAPDAGDGGCDTTVSGTVFAPNGVDPMYDTTVYVPSTTLQPFVDGVTVPHCSCASDVSGTPVTTTVTKFDGSFVLPNVPAGTNVPLVIQRGRWRRVYSVPTVTACKNTPIPSSGSMQLRMPQRQHEFSAYDNIPLMAFVTGSVDALECVLRKVGIADGEFSDPTGTGRVHLFLGSGGPGARYSSSTPSETTLWGTQATIDGYDMVYFDCQGNDYEKTLAQQQIVVNYANAGGRVFATHYSYVWLTNTADNATWSPTAQWTLAEGTFASDPGTGIIDTATPRPTELAQWLQFIGASTTSGQIGVSTLRQDFAAVSSSSLLWLSVNDTGLGNVPLHYTFDTPWNAAPANQCGRVLYSDFHVESATTTGLTFPAECTTAGMTPQEKMVEAMIFDLDGCVAP